MIFTTLAVLGAAIDNHKNCSADEKRRRTEQIYEFPESINQKAVTCRKSAAAAPRNAPTADRHVEEHYEYCEVKQDACYDKRPSIAQIPVVGGGN